MFQNLNTNFVFTHVHVHVPCSLRIHVHVHVLCLNYTYMYHTPSLLFYRAYTTNWTAMDISVYTFMYVGLWNPGKNIDWTFISKLKYKFPIYINQGSPQTSRVEWCSSKDQKDFEALLHSLYMYMYHIKEKNDAAPLFHSLVRILLIIHHVHVP